MGISKLSLKGTEYQFGNVSLTPIQLYDGRELSEYTWVQLQTKCINNDFKNLKIGDYKTITLTDGETVKMQIAGIDTYYCGRYPQTHHHIDWISIDCLKDKVQWNTTAQNAIEFDTYRSSHIASYLDQTIYNKIPLEIKSVIVGKSSIRESRNEGQTNGYATGWALNDGFLWLPHEDEVFGSTILGTRQYSRGSSVQYPLFAHSWKHRIKKLGSSGSKCDWWLRTICGDSTTDVCCIDYYGQIKGVSANTSCGIPLCFRVSIKEEI